MKLPNLDMRDRMVESIRKATVVGILNYGDSIIKARPEYKRPLTDKIFAHYGLKPRYTCNALFNRYAANDPLFWELIRGYRILIVTRNPEGIAKLLSGGPYNQHIAGTISFGHCDELEETVEELKANRNKFDIALISCGVNAVVLAQQVAEAAGKVGIDFGKGLTRLPLSQEAGGNGI